MRRFITYLMLYGFLLVCLITVAQLLLSYRIKGKITGQDDNLQQTSHIDADLIFLGSSRCAMHFDPKFFDSNYHLKSVNLGVSGHSELPMVLTRLNYYLATNKAPKFAVLNFDPFLSGYYNYNYALKDEFARYAFFPSKEDSLIVNYFKFTPAEKYVPLYAIFKYRQLRVCLFPKKSNAFSTYGYELDETHWNGEITQKNLAIRSKYFKQDQIASITASLLQIKKLCDSKHIKLICIQTPVYKALYHDTIFKQINLICQKANVPFLDANDESIINDASNFRNINHLNKKGVLEMNKFLKRNTVFNEFLK